MYAIAGPRSSFATLNFTMLFVLLFSGSGLQATNIA